MKGYSSSKKKKQVLVDDRSGQETATPRVKKCYSTTSSTYLQLQFDTSCKKRQNLQKTLQIKDKRIKDLQKQVKEHQTYIIDSTVKCRELKNQYQHDKKKNQRLQIQLQQAVQLCKAMKDKCKELVQRNQNIQKNQQVLRQRLKTEEIRLKQIKELRKKQKQELRSVIIPLLQSLASKNPSEQLIQYSKIL